MPWYLCLLTAMVCGAVWGAFPGFFKAYFNVNEVITSIMFNWIGLYLVNELMYSTFKGMYDPENYQNLQVKLGFPVFPDSGYGLKQHF